MHDGSAEQENDGRIPGNVHVMNLLQSFLFIHNCAWSMLVSDVSGGGYGTVPPLEGTLFAAVFGVMETTVWMILGEVVSV